MFTIPPMCPMIFGGELHSRYKNSPNHLMTTLFSHNSSSVCHSRKKESMEIFELPIICFHPELLHMTSSHMSLNKANHMFTNLKSVTVLPRVQKERGSTILKNSINVYHNNWVTPLTIFFLVFSFLLSRLLRDQTSTYLSIGK